MRTEFGGLVAAVLLAACGAKNVDLGSDPVAGTSGDGTGGAAASSGKNGMSSATGGSMSSATGDGMAVAGRGSATSGSDITTPPVCGDGRLDMGEGCDDGNSHAGDGCSPSCKAEPGWLCVSGTCAWVCGDHLVGGPEQCVMGECPDPSAVVQPTPPAAGVAPGPCDIYAADGGPCVAAHSTVRALYASYGGPLYRVKKSNGNELDVLPLAPGGFANAAAQDVFCSGDACTISIVYDQSGHGNHLTKAPAGAAKPSQGNEADADALPASFGGHAVYGLQIVPGVAYRNNNACGTATGDDAETEYMVVAGKVHNGGCCFDYGNVERDSQDDGEGSAEAVYFGSSTIWGKGAGQGPWVMGDLENGLWAGNLSPYAMNPSLTFNYVTAMVKGDAAGTNHWTIKVGNAEAGALSKVFDGPRPNARYIPMRKQGAISLGAGTDNSNGAVGNFFEGVMTAGYSTDDADAAVQANLTAAYGAN